MPANETVFDLTREQLDELPFGVITLDRQGIILRYNRAEADLAERSAVVTVGLRFFSDVAPCTDVRAFRGRFEAFAQGIGSGVEIFDFSFLFGWGRHDVSITLLRKAGHEEINILVRGSSDAPVQPALPPAPEHIELSPAVRHDGGSFSERGVAALPQPALYRLGGAEEADIRRAVHADDAEAVRQIVADATAGRHSYAIEYRNVRPDGSTGVVQEIGFFSDECDAGGRAAIVDMTARRQHEEEQWHAAHYDGLTGLPNREYFLARAGTALQAAQGTPKCVAVLVLNIDRFSETNEIYGRDIGNRLLQMLAQRLDELIRAVGSAAYLGLDMFGVLIGEGESELLVTQIAESVLASVADPFVIDGRRYHLTVSIGIHGSASGERDASGLARGAYVAMRAAKADGRGKARWYASEMSVDAANQGRRRNELRAALERDELALYFQPIVDSARDRVVAVEALVRWNHPTRGLLLPGEFIELAHEANFIVALGEWVLREACRHGKRWSELGFDLRVCVNVSAVQFREPNFVSLVASVLEEVGLAPSWLEIELTEGVMVDGFGEMVERLSRLKALGVRLAIDDFGTGYSSLAYLKYFPVDTLKIDRAFVTDIVADTFDRAIATTVLTLADELGLDCVVEGVETIEQLETLSAIGCSIMQGYYFARPMPPSALTALLRGAAGGFGAAETPFPARPAFR